MTETNTLKPKPIEENLKDFETRQRNFIDGSMKFGSHRDLHNWDVMLHDFKPWLNYKHKSLYRTNSCWVVVSRILGADQRWVAVKELFFSKIIK